MNPKALPAPWLDESELAMVRNWFYPAQAEKDPYDTNTQQDMRREAITRVNMWTFKSHQTPSAVLSTADLTDSVIHYEEMARTGDPNAYRAVHFMFAFAFLRFVNAFVDRDVARTAIASLANSEEDAEEERTVRFAGESSMYAYAATISMPSRFVDLRHQVSHGELPDVNVLKKAADEALSWLWDRWWKSSTAADPSAALQRFYARKVQDIQTGSQKTALSGQVLFGNIPILQM